MWVKPTDVFEIVAQSSLKIRLLVQLARDNPLFVSKSVPALQTLQFSLLRIHITIFLSSFVSLELAYHLSVLVHLIFIVHTCNAVACAHFHQSKRVDGDT